MDKICGFQTRLQVTNIDRGLKFQEGAFKRDDDAQEDLLFERLEESQSIFLYKL